MKNQLLEVLFAAFFALGGGFLSVKAEPEVADNPSDQERLKAKAESGDTEAMVWLGATAENDGDTLSAYQWYALALEKGSGEAAFRLGKMSEDGIVLPKDNKAALEYYQKASKLGYIPADPKIGFAYIEGIEVEKDVEKGKKILLDAAKTGDLEAINRLAFAYWFGIGFEQEQNKALETMRQAITPKIIQNPGQDVEAVQAVFMAYFVMLLDKKEYRQALELLESGLASPLFAPGQKLKSNIPNAAFLFLTRPFFYILGLGTERDLKKGNELLGNAFDSFSLLVEKSGTTKEESSLYELFLLQLFQMAILNKSSEEVDLTRLFKNIENLAKEGDSQAQFLLAHCYRDGWGTEKDAQKFEYWLTQAAQSGNSNAQYNAAILIELQKKDSASKERLYRYLSEAVKQGNIRAATALGEFCINQKSSKTAQESGVKLLEEVTEAIKKQKREESKKKKEDEASGFKTHIRYTSWGHGFLELQGLARSRDYPPEAGTDSASETAPDSASGSKNEVYRHGLSKISQYDDLKGVLFTNDLFYDDGDAPALLARCYRKGIVKPRDERQERAYLELAAEWGNVEAKNELAEYFWQRDMDDLALRWNQKALNEGLPRAYFIRYIMLRYKPDGTDNIDQAFPFLLEADRLGCSNAPRRISLYRLQGIGTPRNVEQALKELNESASQGDLFATVCLATVYWAGIEVPQDRKKAFEYIYRYEDWNSVPLCYCFFAAPTAERIDAVLAFLEEAKYKLRADQNRDPLNLALLGQYYDLINSDKAPKLCRQAAQTGDPLGQSLMGCFLIANAENSADWRWIDSDSGNSTKISELGHGGQGQTLSERNRFEQMRRGIQWIKKSAENGLACSWLLLGKIVLQSDNDPKYATTEEGVQWLKRAAEQDIPDACAALAKYYLSQKGNDLEEGNKWIDRGVEMNNPSCLFQKGLLLWYGIKGRAMDKSLGWSLMQKAANLGSKDAQKEMDKITQRTVEREGTTF